MNVSGWRIDPSITFLNHGSFGACPEGVVAAQARWRDRIEANPVRFLARDLEGCLDAARRTVGDFLHADRDGLAFVPNATTGVSTVLRSLRFERGDELLTTDHEYNAIGNALNAAALRDGARVVVAPVPFPIHDEDDVVGPILAAVTPRTRLAVISHVTSPTALVLPIEALVGELRRRGVDTLVDAAHAPGMVPLDLDRLGPAYWTGNGHKWMCGPKGSGILWVREDRRDLIHPLVWSHGLNDPRPPDGTRSRFRVEFDWPGTVDPTPYLALADAIGVVEALAPGRGGWPAIQASNHALAVDGIGRVAAALGAAAPVPEPLLGSMASIELPVEPTEAAADALNLALADEDRIEVPITPWPVRAARGDGAPRKVLLRISAQLYNEPADYDRLAEALARRLNRSTGGRLRPR
ncbi:MAG TPA: aminotransferase class V-fold PLP-dependent enzyme [Candidatus Limnocylindrales bacterium]